MRNRRVTTEPLSGTAVGRMLRNRVHDAGLSAECSDALVDRADADPDIQAVVFTGTHPDRLVSHVEVRWLQGGATVPRSGEDPESSRYR